MFASEFNVTGPVLTLNHYSLLISIADICVVVTVRQAVASIQRATKRTGCCYWWCGRWRRGNTDYCSRNCHRHLSEKTQTEKSR